MQVSELRIHGFRGIANGVIRFGRHSVLLGANNIGKTTIIEALALLLGREGMIRDLTEHDFTGSNPGPKDRIHLVATLTDFASNDPDAHPDWFREGRAVVKWLNIATGKIHPEKIEDEFQLCCQIAFQGYFDAESLTVETIRYFHDSDDPIDPFVDDTPTLVPFHLLRDIGFYLVRASRSWDRMLTFGSELFRRTVRATAAQPSEAILKERDRLRNPDSPIESDKRIEPLLCSVQKELARFVPDGQTLQMRITNTDSRSVLDSVVAHFKHSNGVPIPASRQGSGLVSLQGLLLLMQLGRARHDADESFILALEEPELHLFPPSQRQLVRQIQSLSSQTIVTTHSPTVASSVDPTSAIILRREKNELLPEPLLLSALSANAPNWQRKLFRDHRVAAISALLHSSVLITEGRSDADLLNALLKPLAMDPGWSPNANFDLSVGVFPVEDAKVVETHALLIRLHKHIFCLVDGDEEGARYSAELRKAHLPAEKILSWPAGWDIERLVSWIISADEKAVLSDLAREIEDLPQCSEQVAVFLRSHKRDHVLYEAVAAAISNTPLASERAKGMFEALAYTCQHEEHPSFRMDPTGYRLVFQP